MQIELLDTLKAQRAASDRVESGQRAVRSGLEMLISTMSVDSFPGIPLEESRLETHR